MQFGANQITGGVGPRPLNAPPIKKEMDKDAFMKLFVAQLKHQDPLKPMSDKESIAQMAQFSQLEQMSNMTKTMEGIALGFKKQLTIQASNLIGKNILSNGNGMSKSGSDVSGVALDIPKGMKTVTINVHDTEGNIVKTVILKDPQAGKKDFKWDGKDQNGNDLKDGNYSVSVVAEDKAGKKYLVPTQVEGKVKSVEIVNGEQVLMLENGTKVLFKNVSKITESAKQGVA